MLGICPRSAILKILKVLLHIISRIEIGLQFVSHDDSLVHVAEIEGDYKVRLAFYWNMSDCQRAQLNIDLDGLPVWRKPKIVRTPLKVVTDKSKGNKRLRNKSRKRKSTTSSAKDQPHRMSRCLNPHGTPPPSKDSDHDSPTAKGTLQI